MSLRMGKKGSRRVTGLFSLYQTRTRWTTAGAAAAGIIVLIAAASPAAAPSPRVVRFLGERAADVLSGVNRSEVFVVSTKRAQEDEPALGGYLIRYTHPDQGAPFARAVAALLLDEKSYRFDQSKVGGFRPRLGLRLWNGKRWVEVVVSLSYDEVVVFSPNPGDGSVRSAQADMVPAREALDALIRKTFPDSSEYK